MLRVFYARDEPIIPSSIFLYNPTFLRAIQRILMIKPNVTTCPSCGAHARKIQLRWWQRLWLGGLARYVCSQCKDRFKR